MNFIVLILLLLNFAKSESYLNADSRIFSYLCIALSHMIGMQVYDSIKSLLKQRSPV